MAFIFFCVVDLMLSGKLVSDSIIAVRPYIEHYNDTLKFNDAPVLFMDAVHPTQSTKLSDGWIRKGQESLLKQQVVVLK